MKIHMANGYIYDIPKDVKYANISIAFSDTELLNPPRCVDIRHMERDAAFMKNREVLGGFKYVGYEETYKKDMHMQIEMQWFIHISDLNKCIVSME